MAKPEWGFKRSCQECGAKFYDFLRDPIVCPKCEAVFKIETSPRNRKAKRRDKAPVVKLDAAAAVGALIDDDDKTKDVVVENDNDDKTEDVVVENDDDDDDMMPVDDDNDDNDDIGEELSVDIKPDDPDNN